MAGGPDCLLIGRPPREQVHERSQYSQTKKILKLVFRIHVSAAVIYPYLARSVTDISTLHILGSANPIPYHVIPGWGQHLRSSLVERAEGKAFCERLGNCGKPYVFADFSFPFT